METLIAIVYTGFVIFLLVLLIFFVLYLCAALFSALTNVPYVGSSRRKIRSILAHAEPQEGQTLIDLGSGDGRVVFEAARTFGLKATGVEFNPLLTLFAKALKWVTHAKNVTFKTGNALKAPIKSADIIYVFLLPKLLDPLAEKFKKECKKGTIIISHGFKIKGLGRHRIKKVEDTPFSTYYYKL